MISFQALAPHVHMMKIVCICLLCVCLAAKENFNTKRSINDQQFSHDSLFRAKAIAMPFLLNCIHKSGVHGYRI